jgi:hypothetical protein
MHQLRRLIFLSSIVLAVGVLSPAAANAAARGTDRPLRGVSTSTSTIDLATGAGTSDGTSHVSHCGNTTFHNDFTIILTGPDTFRLVGTDTEVCSNGDKVFSTFEIAGNLSTGTSTGVFTATGGTGRFANATGTFTIEATSTIVSTVGSIVNTNDTNTIEGRISY